jgi:signal peptidase I
MELSAGKGATAAQGARRSPWLALLLSLLLPGLGHIYVGRTRRGAAVLGLLIAWPWLFFFLIREGLLPRFWVFSVLLALVVALVLFGLIDSALKARQAGAHGLRPYRRWYACAGALAVGWVTSTIPCIVAYMIPSSGYFQVPSPSMEPTLRPGEVFLADPSYYRHHVPARGEVIIYLDPKHAAVQFIKRIIALAGDRIALREGRAIVNGTPVDEPYVIVGDPEFLLNNVEEETVPAGHVYVLGDNRAISVDSRSRAEHGPVRVENIVARATEIVFSTKVVRIGRWIGTPAK